jgi:predicted nucleic acid-binding protein
MKTDYKRIFLDTNILMYDFLARNQQYWERLPDNMDMGLINATEAQALIDRYFKP